MTRKSGNFSFAPNSVDAVLRTDDGLVFSVNGAQCEISILQGDDIDRPELLLSGQGGATAVLLKGGIGEISARLEEIYRELIANMTGEAAAPFYRSKGFVAGAAVAAVLIAVGFIHPQATNFLRGLEMRPQAAVPINEDLARHLWSPTLTLYPRSGPDTDRAVISDITTAPDIFDIPGRAMPDPSETTLFPETFDPSEADFKETDETSELAGDAQFAEPAQVPVSADQPSEPGEMGLLGDIKRMSAASKDTTEAPPAETTDTDVPETAAAAVEGETPVTTSVVDEEMITKQITTAISNGSMSAEHAQSFLDALGDLKSDNPQVTKAMLQDLPEDVTSMLAQTGLLDELMASGDGDTEYRIIRLPEEVVELYRGADGIASIPERFSWAATGNYVSLPLPGGGDIKRVEHMKEFGLSLQ